FRRSGHYLHARAHLEQRLVNTSQVSGAIIQQCNHASPYGQSTSLTTVATTNPVAPQLARAFWIAPVQCPVVRSTGGARRHSSADLPKRRNAVFMRQRPEDCAQIARLARLDVISESARLCISSCA